MTKSKLKPRNPLVALARFKPAGAHGKSEKAKRKKENSELQKTIKSQVKPGFFLLWKIMSDYKVEKSSTGRPIKMWTHGVEVEQEAMEQLKRVSELPFIHRHIAVMPDVHLGKGATIGSVIPTKKAIIPAAVGVDTGCGMMAVKTSLKAEDLPDSLANLRSLIEDLIPLSSPEGRTSKQARHVSFLEAMKSVNIQDKNVAVIAKSLKTAGILGDKFKLETITLQLGSLGSGNHFIELNIDEEGFVWITLHSGSRGFGNKIGSYFIAKAQEEMSKYFIELSDANLAFLPEGTPLFEDYIYSLEIAQNYAKLNREVMMAQLQILLRGLFSRITFGEPIQCHHNYATIENHFGENVYVTRKGAVMAREGVLGIIPGSMGTRTYIVRGKGDKESFCSCSHGAGRKMSRTKAIENVSLETHIKDTEGVECRKDAGVLDETPQAYKNLDLVMKAQENLVDIVHTLKPVLCVKG